MTTSPGPSDTGSDSETIVSLLHAIQCRLASMEERLDTLEERTDPRTFEPMAATAVDIVDGWAAKAFNEGVDVDARGRDLLRIIERTTRPHTLRNLERALDQFEHLPMAIATMTDVVDSFVARQVERGVDPVELTANIGRSLDRFARFVQTDTFDSLVESGVFDPDAVEVVAMAGEAMATERHEGSRSTGAFGLLGALRDPDVQRSVGFGIGFARRLGRSLQNRQQIEDKG